MSALVTGTVVLVIIYLWIRIADSLDTFTMFWQFVWSTFLIALLVGSGWAIGTAAQELWHWLSRI